MAVTQGGSLAHTQEPKGGAAVRGERLFDVKALPVICHHDRHEFRAIAKPNDHFRGISVLHDVGERFLCHAK